MTCTADPPPLADEFNLRLYNKRGLVLKDRLKGLSPWGAPRNADFLSPSSSQLTS